MSEQQTAVTNFLLGAPTAQEKEKLEQEERERSTVEKDSPDFDSTRNSLSHTELCTDGTSISAAKPSRT